MLGTWVVDDTFVDVLASEAITAEAVLARAFEATEGVDAVSVGVTVVLAKSALVLVEAVDSVTVETFVASALEATSSVHAGSVW